MILIGRREDRLVLLRKELLHEFPGLRCHIEALSVCDVEKVFQLPDKLPEDFKKVDILVNNAGLALGGLYAYILLTSSQQFTSSYLFIY